MSYSFLNGLIFGIISALAGFLFVQEPHGDGWESLWISTGTAGFITGYIFSKFLVTKPKKYSNSRLVITGVIIGILSHWMHWYISLIANYIYVEFLGTYMYGEPINPLEGLFAAIQLSFISLLFFGWTAIPLAIGALYLTLLIKRTTKN